MAEELGCSFRRGDRGWGFIEDEVMEGCAFSGDDLFSRGVKEEFFGFVDERLREPVSEDFGGLSDFGVGTGVIDIDAEEEGGVADGGAGAEFDAASADHECFVAA